MIKTINQGRRESKWTSVYMDPSNRVDPWYIRLTPTFMNMEETGFSHGLSISGNSFPTRHTAERCADMYDQFFEAMYEAIKAEA